SSKKDCSIKSSTISFTVTIPSSSALSFENAFLKNSKILVSLSYESISSKLESLTISLTLSISNSLTLEPSALLTLFNSIISTLLLRLLNLILLNLYHKGNTDLTFLLIHNQIVLFHQYQYIQQFFPILIYHQDNGL